jgi:hypothetical protein
MRFDRWRRLLLKTLLLFLFVSARLPVSVLLQRHEAVRAVVASRRDGLVREGEAGLHQHLQSEKPKLCQVPGAERGAPSILAAACRLGRALLGDGGVTRARRGGEPAELAVDGCGKVWE